MRLCRPKQQSDPRDVCELIANLFFQNSKNQQKVGKVGMAKMDMNDTKPAIIKNANAKGCIGQ